MRHVLLLPVLALPLVASCSGSLQGPPAFVQTYGTVDEPCVPSPTAVGHCTAHVYLVNRGGEGDAVATVAVPVGVTKASATAPPKAASQKCGAYVPDTPGGSVVDLTCAFDLPIGTAVTGPPILLALSFTSAASPTTAGDAGVVGVVNLALAVLAALAALVALALAITSRDRSRMPAPARPGSVGGLPEKQDDEDDEQW